MERGLIALDIDGTITTQLLSMPPRVASFLDKINHDQWQVIFLTGRTFAFAYQVLQVLKFRYFLGVNNGAMILDMPSRTIVQKSFLSRPTLHDMDEICRSHQTDYVIYSGYENDDKVYYRSEFLPPEELRYIVTRGKAFKEPMIEVASYNDLPVYEYASLKCFGDETLAKTLSHEIETKLDLHSPIIKDPFGENRYITQATHPDVTKGKAVNDIKERLDVHGPVIVAGDDYNDLSLFEAGEIKVAMGNSPKVLMEKATIVAPTASQEGIISGLTQALKLAEGKS